MKKKKKKAIDPSVLTRLILPRQDTMVRKTRSRRGFGTSQRIHVGKYGVGVESERDRSPKHLKPFLNTDFTNILELDDNVYLKNKKSIKKTAKDVYESGLTRSERNVMNFAKGLKKKSNSGEKGTGKRRVLVMKEQRFRNYQVEDFSVEEVDANSVDTTRMCHPRHRRNEIVQQSRNKMFRQKAREVLGRKKKLKKQMRLRYPNGSINLENRLEPNSSVFKTSKFQQQRKNIERMKRLGQRRRDFLTKKKLSNVFNMENLGKDICSKSKGKYFNKMTKSENVQSLVFGDGSKFRHRRELKTASPAVTRDFSIIAPNINW